MAGVEGGGSAYGGDYTGGAGGEGVRREVWWWGRGYEEVALVTGWRACIAWALEQRC